MCVSIFLVVYVCNIFVVSVCVSSSFFKYGARWGRFIIIYIHICACVCVCVHTRTHTHTERERGGEMKIKK